MTTQEHTPGPWKVGEWIGQALPVIDQNGGLIALTDISWFSTSIAEVDANTRLIAAAPKMLDALQRIANGDGYYGAQAAREYKEIARAAIACI